jgi:hypothetical protein
MKDSPTGDRTLTGFECTYYGYFMEYASLLWKQSPRNVTPRQVTELLTIAKGLKVKSPCEARKSAGCSHSASKILVPINDGIPEVHNALLICGDSTCFEWARKQLRETTETYDFTLEGSYCLFDKYKNPDTMETFGLKLLEAWELASSDGIKDQQKIHEYFWRPYDGLRAYLASSGW